MVKSMYAAVAGLKAHQSKMDVIGNNIANVNTWGYKTQNTSFKESMYQTISSGSSGSLSDGGLGATNPSMVGYGSMVSAISSNFTVGSPSPTGRGMDCFIDGTAFFAVGPIYGEGESRTPNDMYVSRVGDFGVRNGYMVDGNGRYVYGFPVSQGGQVTKQESTTITTTETNKFIPDTGLPKPLVSKNTDGTYTVTMYKAHKTNTPPLDDGKMDVYTYTNSATDPAKGSVVLAPPVVTEEANTNHLTDPSINDTVALKSGPTVSGTNTEFVIEKVSFKLKPGDSSQLVKTVETTTVTIPTADLAGYTKVKPLPIPESTTKTDANGITTVITYKPRTEEGTMDITTSVTTPNAGQTTFTGPQYEDGRMLFDNKTGSYTLASGLETLKPLKIPSEATYYDEAGKMQTEKDIIYDSFTIKDDGSIWGTSSTTNKAYLVGSIGLINVLNPNGMSKSDGPYYQMTGSSGEGQIVAAGGSNKLATGNLEMANVDIATEFSTMITTQRGFQANSKIITVTDEMLQELVNMKR